MAMHAYLVRFAPSRQLVGIYFCHGPRDLWCLIDEIMDPSECEFVALPEGGFTWQFEEEKQTVPAIIEVDEHDEIADFPEICFNAPDVVGQWRSVFWRRANAPDLKWTNFGSAL